MQDKLIDFYINKNQPEVDLFLINNVNPDNVIETLNKIYNFNWSYEVTEIKEILNNMYATIVLYTPGRVITSVASSNENADKLISVALSKALKYMYKTFEDKPNETILENNEDKKEEEEIQTTTLEQLEKEIEGPTKNPYGIRNDQITFINNFKNTHNIDTDEKFNYYVKTWSDNTGREINTKKELITAGEAAVDLFIKWISIVSMDNSTSDLKVSSPI